ncbi:MAG TPA: hypothetical protein VGO96_16525 [Pyrinomonadaceae bacterium]|jgi:hypothetical protein|nr:hypothetical protein [Pyrinomonadaceae bacterium]
MSEGLTYRLFEERDLPGLLRLWEEAGWGVIGEEQWREWFLDTPHGACLIMVAEDARGEVVGQEIFTPARVSVGDREVSALRLSAPILRQEARRDSVRSREHPAVALYYAAEAEAIAQGYSIVYTLPEHSWLPALRRLTRFRTAEFDCATFCLDAELPSQIVEAAAELYAQPVVAFGEEYEALWRAACENFKGTCGVVRRPRWLAYRNSGRVALEVRRRRDESLCGYVAVKKRGGLIADALAPCTQELTGVLAAAIVYLAHARRDGLAPTDSDTLKAMATPSLRPALGSLGFAPTDYKFAFACNSIDETLPAGRVAPECWYVMPGD